MQRSYHPRLSLNLQSLCLNPDILSAQVITPDTPNPSSLVVDVSTSPKPTNTMHSRRKTYAGDFAIATRGAINDYQERIALLESQNSRISGELDATRNALVDEREERKLERQSVIMTAPTGLPSQSGLDCHISEQSEILYERKLRMEILDSLKKVRAQNMTLSRSLRECQDNYASLGSVLEIEQREKDELRGEIKRLTQKNFMLFEHNKLLVGRDSAMQEEISSLMTKSQADDWMRSVLEEELQRTRQSSQTAGPGSADKDFGNDNHSSISAHVCAPAITLEHQGPLRAQLVAVRDELHVARRCFEASETKCEELDNRVSSLQREMSQCLDSSALALEAERELRDEVSRTLEEENTRLRDELSRLLKSQRQKGLVNHIDYVPSIDPVANKANMETSSRKVDQISPAIICGEVQKITVDVRNTTLSPTVDDMPETALKVRRRERLLERQLRLSSSKKIARRRSSLRASRSGLFASVASPTITEAPVFQSLLIPSPRIPPSEAPVSIGTDSASTSRRTSPIIPEPAEARINKRNSVLRPLRLSSPEKLPPVRSAPRPPSRLISTVIPSPTPPSVRPPTPKKQNSAEDKWRHRFRDDSLPTAKYPGSPDSSASTLVSPAAAPAYITKSPKSIMITNTLSKKPSFNELKSSTTLFLEKSQLPAPNLTRTQNIVPPSHMRRASAVLASIARSTGIGSSLEDWLVL